MSDAALVGQAQNPSDKAKKESLSHGGPHHEAPHSHILQSQASVNNASGGASHITTEGNIVSSNDPTTRSDASLGQKLKGDFAGAIHGTLGSIQAATGTLFGNKEMHAKGLEKMQEEDQRIGAKRGVMPVGSDRRNTTADADATGGSIPK